MDLASSVDPPLDVLAELASLRVGGLVLEQGQLLFQFLGFGLDVRQTRLPLVGMHPIIRGVGVGDERPGKALAQDRLGRFGGTVRIQVKESQVGVSGIPGPIRVALVPPGGFVGMNDGQRADLLPQILIERQTAADGLTFGNHKRWPARSADQRNR